MDETLGEMRIHYAGFAHPFFGVDREDGEVGTPLIFEVRAHNLDIMLTDGERLAKLIFYKMSEKAEPEPEENPDDRNQEEEVGEGYTNQKLTRSNFFKNWPEHLESNEQGEVSEKEGQG